MARDRSLSVKLRADVSGYLAAMKSAGSATRDFSTAAGANAKAHKADWERVGQSVTIAGLAIAAGVGLAVKKFMDFDAAMSAASAATRATSRDLGLLREAALKAGADTQYSATEAAQAITELGKAGVSTADILGGGLTGALSLAAAGQMDVAKAAELSAVAMKQFNLKGSDLGHVADLLAAGAGKAVGSVEDMGMALKQSGLVAAQTGVSIEETTGTLAAFASAGLIGSDAGTSFKSMLQRLTPQSKEAADKMAELGLSAYDASGNFIGMSEFAGRLRASLSRLTVEQRNSALATIFGADAVRAAAVLYDQGADGIARWTQNVNDAGFAADQAARLTDNLRGDVERLGGSFDTALIKAGSGANGALRGLTQALEGAVNVFGNLPPAAQSATIYLGATAAAVALVGGSVMTAIPKVQAFKASLVEMGLTSSATATRLAAVAKGVGLVAAAAGTVSIAYAGMQTAVNGWMGANDDAVKSLEALLKAGTKAEGVTGSMRSGFYDLGSAVERVFNENAWIRATNVLDSVMFWDGSQAGSSIEFFRQMDAALAGFVSSGRGEQAAETFKRITDEAELQGIPIDRLKQAFPQYAAAIDQATAAQDAMGGSTSATVKSVQDYVDRASQATEATKAYAEALAGFASPALDAREANRQWEESIDNASRAIEANVKAQENSKLSSAEHAAATRQAESALDGMTHGAIQNVAALAANGATQGQLQQVTDESAKQIYNMALKFYGSEAAAKRYTDELFRIPATRATQVTADTSRAQAALQGLYNYWSAKTIQLRVNAQADRFGMRNASGGYITGPGTATSDSIPAWLSNGEYVVKAAAVNKYGVDFLHAINGLRFADGGSVGRSMSTTSNTYVTGPSAGELRAALDGMRIDLGAVDPITRHVSGVLLAAVGSV